MKKYIVCAIALIFCLAAWHVFLSSGCGNAATLTLFKANRGYIFQIDKEYNLKTSKGQIDFQDSAPCLSHYKPKENEVRFAEPKIIEKKLTKEEQEQIKRLLKLSIPELENGSRFGVRKLSYALLHININGKNFVLHMKDKTTLSPAPHVEYSNAQSLYDYILGLSPIPVDLDLENFLEDGFSISQDTQ